ncbi:metal-dependent hydrolase [Halopelagius longus]|uniref:Inner membrane protein n=1 Tax=Halopelagius longus TaxID=1236180 RepID=A0A1H1DSP2_9EURY|nr:metal-dependent hydrolase [Halopelagius longus]RDI71433.1 metal-dependent hydrolase [Halopelagius longus]SDQ78906.1 inner membrane protein [Halopelagius longus]
MVSLSHLGYLATAVATHALVGYTLGTLAFDAPRAGVLGGVVADVDLFFPLAWEFPLTHRGLTHTGLAVGAALAVAAVRSRAAAGGVGVDETQSVSSARRTMSVGVGYASHLLIDSTTPMGVPLFYPLSTARVGVQMGGHSGPATAALWLCCLAALWTRRRSGRLDEQT